jgi:hypothetical protein
MAPASPGWRRALAMLVIVQGLSHLLLRPEFDPANFMATILYGVAVVGFAAAGIGVSGVTPFTAAARPCLVLASGYSLVLTLIAGTAGVFWVPVLDVLLLLAGLTGIYGRLPIGASHPGLPHRLAVSASTALVLFLAYAVIWWRG